MKVIKNFIFLFIFLGWSLILSLSFAWAQNKDGFMVNPDGSEKEINLDEVTVVAKKKERSTTSTPSWNTFSCQWIKLNTDVPFIGNCIETTNKENATTQLNAFPRLMGAMMKLIMMTILIMSFLMIVAGGVLLTMKGSVKQVEDGMALIQKVAIGMALLGASGVILKLINPNFFV